MRGLILGSCLGILAFAPVASAGEVYITNAVGDWTWKDGYSLDSLVTLPTHHAVLRSGLQVVIQPDPTADVVTFSMVLDAGMADAGGTEGELAHLVEHLWSQSRGPDGATVEQRLNLLGCSSNAATTISYVTYWVACPAAAFEEVLGIEARLLSDPLAGLTVDDFDRDRAIVRAEQRYRGDGMPAAAVSAMLSAALPADHVLAPMRTQRPEQLEDLTLSQAQAFVDRTYSPVRATVYVGGNVGVAADEAFDHVVALLPADAVGADLDQPTRRTFRAGRMYDVPVKLASTAPIVLTAPTSRPLLLLAWTAPGSWRPTDGALRGLPGLLEQQAFPDGSRRGRGAVVDCDLLPAPEVSIIYCATYVDEGVDRDELAERLVKQTFRVRGSEARSLNYRTAAYGARMAKWYTMVSAEDLSHQDGRAQSVSLHAHMTGRASWISDTIQSSQRWNWDELEEMAKAALQADRAVIIHVQPDPDAAEDTGADAHASSGAGLSDAPVPADLSAWLIKEKSASLQVSRMESATLDNGLEVLAIQHGSLPGWVSAGLAFQTGDASPKTTALNLINSIQSPEDPKFMGLVQVMGGPGWSGQMYTSREAELPGALGDLVPPKMNAAYTGPLVKLVGKFAATATQQNAARMWVSDLHQDLSWVSADVDAERPAVSQVIQAGRDRYRPDNALLVVVGDIDPTKAISQIKESPLARWSPHKKSTAKPTSMVGSAKSTPGYVYIDDYDSVQTYVQWTCRLSNVPLDDRQALEVGAAWARQRLWRQFRSERGWSYGVHVRTAVGPAGDAVLHLSVDTPAANVPAILAEVDKALASEVDAADVLGVSYQLGLRYGLDTQTHAQLMSEVVEQSIAGANLDWHASRNVRLARVKSEDVSRVLDGCVDRHVVELVGRKAEIEPMLTAAGIEWKPSLELDEEE